MRAVVVTQDGEVTGIAGVARERDWGKFFSDYKPQLQPYLKSITVMRAVKDALQIVREYRGPVLAIARDAEGCRILHRLGFTHLHGAWYGWLS